MTERLAQMKSLGIRDRDIVLGTHTVRRRSAIEELGDLLRQRGRAVWSAEGSRSSSWRPVESPSRTSRCRSLASAGLSSASSVVSQRSPVSRTGSCISVGKGAAARVGPADLVGPGAARQDSNERWPCFAEQARAAVRCVTRRRGPIVDRVTWDRTSARCSRTPLWQSTSGSSASTTPRCRRRSDALRVCGRSLVSQRHRGRGRSRLICRKQRVRRPRPRRRVHMEDTQIDA